MISTQQAVNSIVNKNPLYREILSQKVANFHKLAQLIKNQVEAEAKKEIKINTIVVALSRIAKTLEVIDIGLFIQKHLYNFQIQTPISELIIEKNSSNLSILKEFFSKKKFIGVIVGEDEINLICTKKVADYFLKKIKIKKHLSNLTSLSIRFDEKLVKTPGLFYHLSSLFFLNKINIIEVISTYTQINFIIENQYLSQAISILNKQIGKEDLK